MASLRKGDVVLVTKLDRLGRSTRELLELVHRIDQAGASFKSLGDPLFDTTTSQGRVLVTMLAAIAEFERELIRERTGEGRKRAMAAGRPVRKAPRARSFSATGGNQTTARWRAVKPNRPKLSRERKNHRTIGKEEPVKNSLILVVIALVLAALWTWATMPSPAPSKHLPRSPLTLYSEIG
jgi:DNA invertase Pin-like site-specific DNA recombinase